MSPLSLGLRSVRCVAVVLAIGHGGTILYGGYLLVSPLVGCSGKVKLPFTVTSMSAAVRLLCMVGSGLAQLATASMIVNHPTESSVVDAVVRHERRMRYKRWLLWTRLGVGVSVLQFLSALYLIIIFWKIFSHNENLKECHLGDDADSHRTCILVVLFLILAWLIVAIQCFAGSDVLRWRSFYAAHDMAWKAHYLEVFDHGIREALCCLGRVKYLSVLEEDEVYSVARLLGDLVSYRATGTGHFEFLAGLTLLQSQRQSPTIYDEHVQAPKSRVRDAASYHQFAEAAYTGPLLDFGRNPILFPCAWVYRQGVLTPWTRHRRPVLEGDNWWRGHAAAFLKYANLSPDTLYRGRVIQTKREAAYFIVVLHDMKSVVIAVRGTETPEDLLTDGLCRECTLTVEDLDGLINGSNLAPEIREAALSSSHYGHAGIINSARELFMQVDGHPFGNDACTSKSQGFLSSLLGSQQCHGYRLYIVGHSLGGSVAALLGIRLYGRFPNLHVFAYGPLPCVNSFVAEACSEFITSIVYNDEFSSRLSVNSIVRLQNDAIRTLSNDSSPDSAIISKFARRMLVTRQKTNLQGQYNTQSFHSSMSRVDDDNQVYRRSSKYSSIGPFVAGSDFRAQEVECQGDLLHDSLNCGYKDTQRNDVYNNSKYLLEGSSDSFQRGISCLASGASQSEAIASPPEVFLPGLIVHIVPENRSLFPLCKSWGTRGTKQGYRAFLGKREDFRDMIVSPYMFLDHLPWRCHFALQKVLETWKDEGLLADDPFVGLNIV